MAKSSFFSGTGTTANDVNSVTSSKAAAEAAATNAATSATNAAASASSALSSSNSASTSATSATNSAVSASSSETNSAASEVASAASAVSAANSASSASTSSIAAANSASQAASSATSAAASAASVGTEAADAAASALAASTSAAAAAASEQSSATSETNSAASELAAATSETASAASAVSAAASSSSASASAAAAAADAASTAADALSTAADRASATISAANAATSATAAAASQLAAAQSASSAATAYDTFDDRYLGSKTVDPTLDNDSQALVAGALYFNSSANEMRVYDGANWIAATSAGNASLLEYNYTATSGQTTFSGADDSSNTMSYTQDNLIVTLNGVVLENGTDYTATTGTSIVLSSGAAANDELNVIAFKSFTTADMVSATNGGTFYNNIDVQGTISADGLTVNGSVVFDSSAAAANIVRIDGSVSQNTRLVFQENATDKWNIGANTAGYFNIYDAFNSANRLRVDNNGDISFYEDTGTTAKFFWDASAESLGIGAGDINLSGVGTASQNVVTTIQGNNQFRGILELANSTGVSSAGSSAGDIAWFDNDNKIAQISGLGQDITNHDDGELAFSTTSGGTLSEAMRIDSSGNVGIGTSSPLSVTNYTALTVQNNTYGGIVQVKDDTVDLRLQIQPDTAGRVGTHSNHPVRFDTNGTERMRIDSSGNVGIGTSSPAYQIDIQGSSNNALRLKTSSPILRLEDSDDNAYHTIIGSSDDLYITSDAGNTGGGNMIFRNGGTTERMRIDSSGNLLVGTTIGSLAYTTNAGAAIYADGSHANSRNGGIAGYYNRITSDGDIVVFNKNGSTVGSIGSNAGQRLTMGNADVGLIYQTDSTDYIGPYSMTAVGGRDNAINLGFPTNRFKDLYLSGGVYLGGTGAANKLDDYEVGSFVAGINFAGDESGITYSNQEGVYVKTGRLVTCFIRISLSSNGTAVSGQAQFINLPFTVSDIMTTTAVQGSSVIGFMDGFGSSYTVATAHPWEGTTTARICYKSAADTGSMQNLAGPTQITDYFDCRLTLQYITNA